MLDFRKLFTKRCKHTRLSVLIYRLERQFQSESLKNTLAIPLNEVTNFTQAIVGLLVQKNAQSSKRPKFKPG